MIIKLLGIVTIAGAKNCLLAFKTPVAIADNTKKQKLGEISPGVKSTAKSN